MRRAAASALTWVGAGVLVVLVARLVAYALLPSPEARFFGQQAGGPGLPLIAVVSLALAASLAVVICWLTAFGIRERALLERRVLATPPPRLRVLRMVALAGALSLATSAAGGLLEAYLHWRAGLGWHGLHCVFGPVHRDLLPLEASLSFVTAAVLAAVEQVVAWMRRTFAALRTLPPRVRADVPASRAHVFDVLRAVLCANAGGPRAPPALA